MRVRMQATQIRSGEKSRRVIRLVVILSAIQTLQLNEVEHPPFTQGRSSVWASSTSVRRVAAVLRSGSRCVGRGPQIGCSSSGPQWGTCKAHKGKPEGMSQSVQKVLQCEQRKT